MAHRRGVLKPVNLLDFAASAVGMPVTWHPPHRPRRAVFPHRVPRLYSRSRKARTSSKHPPALSLSDAGAHYLHALEDLGKSLPVETPALATSPIEPLERTVHGPVVEAVKRAGVASYAKVVVVPLQPAVETPEEVVSRPMPVLLDPCLDPPARRLQFLARGASFYPRCPLTGFKPVEFEAQEGEPGRGALRVRAPRPMGGCGCTSSGYIRRAVGPMAVRGFMPR
jgi:hypothetical protein